MAIGAFGMLDPEERKGLAEAAEGGDEEALEELRADSVEAIEAMIGALEDEDARRLIGLGMMLGYTSAQTAPPTQTGEIGGSLGRDIRADDTLASLQSRPEPGSLGALNWNSTDMEFDGLLNMVKERLEAELESITANGLTWDGSLDGESLR